jgi:hypothetical protein
MNFADEANFVPGGAFVGPFYMGELVAIPRTMLNLGIHAKGMNFYSSFGRHGASTKKLFVHGGCLPMVYPRPVRRRSEPYPRPFIFEPSVKLSVFAFLSAYRLRTTLSVVLLFFSLSLTPEIDSNSLSATSVTGCNSTRRAQHLGAIY